MPGDHLCGCTSPVEEFHFYIGRQYLRCHKIALFVNFENAQTRTAWLSVKNFSRFSKGYFSLDDFYVWAAFNRQNTKNNYHHGSFGPSLRGKTLSVSLFFTHGMHQNVKNR